MEKRYYLTRKQVAELFGVSAKWLANLSSQGRGPRYFKLGRKVLYRAEDVQAWIQKNATQVKTKT